MTTPAEQYRALVNKLESIQEADATAMPEYIIKFQKNPNYNSQGTADQRQDFTSKGATVDINGKPVPVVVNPGATLDGIKGTPITVLSHYKSPEKYHRGILDAAGQVFLSQDTLEALRVEYSLRSRL
jgi:hypothetical protein